MRTGYTPMGEVVCHHNILETLLNEEELRKKLEDWKPKKEVDKRMEEISHKAQTILLYGDTYLLTQLR